MHELLDVSHLQGSYKLVAEIIPSCLIACEQGRVLGI